MKLRGVPSKEPQAVTGVEIRLMPAHEMRIPF